MHDVIIIGGSYAGLAAALQLGRARRDVLVLDAGQRRNRFVRHAHGFLGSDGQPPEAIVERGRANVRAYATVTLREALATDVRAIDGGFAVRAGDDEHRARRLILATGVRDELPAIAGLAERWGRGVFHCPYCDGYERDRGPLAVLAAGASSVHHALLIADWGPTTLLVNGAIDLDAAELARLADRGVAIERGAVAAIAGAPPALEIQLRDGRALAVAGLFIAPRTVPNEQFAAQLGCELEAGPLGRFYRTDAAKETTVPGVFACGDVATAQTAVAMAVSDGTRAGVAAHQSLIFR